MRTYSETIATGSIEGDAAYVAAYGIYLMNGGRPDDFLDMTPDDVQIMLATYLALQRRQADALIRRMWSKGE